MRTVGSALLALLVIRCRHRLFDSQLLQRVQHMALPGYLTREVRHIRGLRIQEPSL